MKKLIFVLLMSIALSHQFSFAQERDTTLLKPQYGSTPYKDFIADAPWRVKSANTKIPIVVTIKDADQNNCTLKYIRVTNIVNSEIIDTFNPEPDIEINTKRWERIFESKSASDLGISVGDTLKVLVEINYNDILGSHTFKQYLQIKIGDSKFPTISGWLHGDTHFHSEFTDNLYEFGASINAVSKATSAMGLDWLTVTDHSCDFDSDGILFNSLQTSIDQYNIESSCRLIRGEEVTLDNDNINNPQILNLPDSKIHLLVYDNGFIRGPENPICQTTDVSDDLTKLQDALNTINTGFVYAAHPTANSDPWEYAISVLTIGYLMPWSSSNYDAAVSSDKFKGLEIWNSRRLWDKNVDDYNINPFPWSGSKFTEYDQLLQSGIDVWSSKLLMNRNPLKKLFLSGGSDAHGDLNYCTKLTLLEGIKATDNAIAKVRTVVYCPSGLDTNNENLLTALKNGNTIVTDGPIVIFNIDLNGDGIINQEDAIIGNDKTCLSGDIDNGKIKMQIKWKNTDEFGGAIKSMKLYYNQFAYEMIGKFGITDTTEGEVWISLKDLRNQLGLVFQFNEYFLFRLESFTQERLNRCYTNPIWLKIINAPQISVQQVTLNKSVFAPGENATLTITLADGLAGATVKFTVNGIEYTCDEIGDGVYQKIFTVPSANNTYPVDITASKSGYTDGQAQIDLVVSNSTLTITTDPLSIPFTGASSSTIGVTVRDGLGNPQSGVQVSFTPPLNGPKGSCNPGTAITGADGIASSVYPPNGVGTAIIDVSTNTGLDGTARVTVNKVDGIYNVSMSIRQVSKITGVSVTYELSPYVTYAASGVCVDNVSIEVCTNCGTFNGQQCFTDVLGLNNSCGKIGIHPQLVITTDCEAIITATVGGEEHYFHINACVSCPVNTIQPLASLSGGNTTMDGTERNVAWSPNGSLLAGGGQQGYLWSFPNLVSKHTTPNTGTAVDVVSFSKTGKKLIFGRISDNPVWYIYDTEADEEISENPSGTTAYSVAWSDLSDERFFAIANGYNDGSAKYKEIKFYANSTNTFANTDPSSRRIEGIEWKGNYLVAVQDSFVYLFDATPSGLTGGTRSYLWKKNTGRSYKHSVAISPNGTKIAVFGRKYSGFDNLFIFDCLSGTLLHQYAIGAIADYYSVDWSPDGSLIVVGGDNGYCRIMDPSDGQDKYVLNIAGPVYSVSWSSKNIIAAITNSETKLFAPFDLDGPSIKLITPEVGFISIKDTASITGTITDPIGIDSAWYSMDGIVYIPMPLVLDTVFSQLITLGIGKNDIRIRVRDRNQNYSEVLRTIYFVLPPNNPQLINPANHTSGIGKSVLLNWVSDSDVITYHLQVALDSQFTNLVIDDSLLTDTNATFNNLNPLNKYYWRVRSKNSGGVSTFSPYWDFMTMGLPIRVELILPANNAVNVPINLWFQWRKSTDQQLLLKSSSTNNPNQNLTVGRYWFEQVTDTNSFLEAYRDSIIADTGKFRSNFLNGTTYYWRVKAKNEFGWGDFSQWWKYTTIIDTPDVPIPASPGQQTIEQPTSLIFYWQASARAEKYYFQISSDSLFTNIFRESPPITDTSYQVDSLENNTDYYWHVKAMNIGGTSGWSEVGKFTTTVDIVSEKDVLPDIFSVCQNYPNPFNPSTIIKYGLPQSAHVILNVYNTLGQRVALLVDEKQEAGYHEVNFNATSLPSGVYFYRLQAGDYIETKKLLLMK